MEFFFYFCFLIKLPPLDWCLFHSLGCVNTLKFNFDSSKHERLELVAIRMENWIELDAACFLHTIAHRDPDLRWAGPCVHPTRVCAGIRTVRVWVAEVLGKHSYGTSLWNGRSTSSAHKRHRSKDSLRTESFSTSKIFASLIAVLCRSSKRQTTYLMASRAPLFARKWCSLSRAWSIWQVGLNGSCLTF